MTVAQLLSESCKVLCAGRPKRAWQARSILSADHLVATTGPTRLGAFAAQGLSPVHELLLGFQANMFRHPQAKPSPGAGTSEQVPLV